MLATILIKNKDLKPNKPIFENIEAHIKHMIKSTLMKRYIYNIETKTYLQQICFLGPDIEHNFFVTLRSKILSHL